MGDLLVEETIVSIEVGKRIGIIGANDIQVAPYRQKGDDRIRFLSVGDVKHAKDLPEKNFDVVIVNSRLPEDTIKNIETICDRGRVRMLLFVENSARLARFAESYPYHSKGVVSLTINGVNQIIEDEKQKKPTPVQPPAPPTTETTAPQPAPAPPSPTMDPKNPPSPPSPNPPHRLSLNELLSQMARIYKEHDGDSGRVIAYFRAHGITPDMRTDSAIRQHVYRIRDGKDNGHHSVTPPPTTLDLDPELHARLREAIEASKAAEGKLFGLFHEIGTENERLRARNTELEGQTADLSVQQTEIARLKGRLNPFLKAAGLPEEV